MLRVGTYNAIIAPNSFYSPEHSDFSQSHKTFKTMMPTFDGKYLRSTVVPQESYSSGDTGDKWRATT
jgi:hypothetical protein